MTASSAEEEYIGRIIRSTPIIDNHAHPLLKADKLDKYNLLTIATEAHGDALKDSTTSFAHLRAVKVLAKQLKCDQSWDAVSAAIASRRETDYDTWTKECLSGIQCILVDDGLDSTEDAHEYHHFDRFVASSSKRIVRIEYEAAKMIEDACTTQTTAKAAWNQVSDDFVAMVNDAIEDDEVVGFKSVICYRTGLDIARKPAPTEAMAAFAGIYESRNQSEATKFTKLDQEGLSDYFVHLLAATIAKQGANKPIQFHTGLGDNDLTLTRASPAHLQDFIREYPTVPIVLLHSGYPFARESSYLAAMYANVYSDIGEVFPFLSRQGQENVVQETLELCPWSKMLWSTDGHWFPETYFLAVEQMREVFTTVIGSYIQKGDITRLQAKQLVEDVLFNNSNRLYNLNLSPQMTTPTAQIPGINTVIRTGDDIVTTDLQLLSQYLADKQIATPKYLRVSCMDYASTLRTRLIPMRQIWATLDSGKTLAYSITKAILGALQNDTLIEGVHGTGSLMMRADLNNLFLGPRDGHLFVMSSLTENDGSAVALCARTALQQAVANSIDKGGLEFEIGFEIEFMLLKRNPESDALEFLPASNGHNWCSARALDHAVAGTIIEEAIEQLAAAGVYIEMAHAESAQGQYEIVLPRAAPLRAVDMVIFAREVIAACALEHGYQMTLHPKPLAQACGTASHVHISMHKNGIEVEGAISESFYANILQHLPALCALTHGNRVSYERVQDGFWAGGTWVTWGTQNRETPLRKVKDSHWEIKCMDGMANPYLALAAIIGCGTAGVLQGASLDQWADCNSDPSLLSAEERAELGISIKLPGDAETALEALRGDLELKRILGEDVVERYVAVKQKEDEFLKEMDADELSKWILGKF